VSQATFSLRGHNPDVLTCIANLSNDEVFTPPEFANRMLDTLEAAWAESHRGAVIWEDPAVKFLDPFTKSGVFLREIVSRLTTGLAGHIPDLADRVDHILTKQVYGIGISELTSLLARRSLYCSKYANGAHSVAKSFTIEHGNIWFERTEHVWEGGTRRLQPHATKTNEEVAVWVGRRCKYCGASEGEYAREAGLETHAYAFIHTDDIKARMAELFGDNMQFDVIIGNPPYQLGSDGGTRDVPIYQHFVEQAKKLEPRFLTMVIPSRWMATGLGLTEFRKTMLADRRLHDLIDYEVMSEVFPGVDFEGGACYFLWDRDYHGETAYSNVRGGEVRGPNMRVLDEVDVLVRDQRAVEILRKVRAESFESITTILSVDKEFGWTSNFAGFHSKEQAGDIPLRYNHQGKRGIGYIARSEVTKSAHLIDKWKVMVSKAFGERGAIPARVLGKPFIVSSPSVCTQTYLFFYVDSATEAEHLQAYLSTKFFRFLVSLRKITQDASRSTYTWVPMQTWDRDWTDAQLYEKYELDQEQIDYIESVIKPMELGDE